MIAQISGPSLSTDTLERVNQIDTRATVQTRITPAIVDVLVTMHPCIPGVTNASATAASASAAAWCPLTPAPGLLVHHAELRIMGGWLGTILPLPLLRTVAVVICLRVETRRRISARVRAAMILVDLALVSGETDRTYALVRVHQISALATVLAGFRGALVDVHVAILARIACGAAAVIIVDQIDAQRPVLALADAIVDVLRAVLPRETAPAPTLVITGKIHTGQRILAGGFLEGALIHVELAKHSLPGRWTIAHKLVLPVDAGAPILARLGGALVYVRRAVRARESRGALAVRALTELPARRSVGARVGGARVVHLLAGRSRESLGAGAFVLVRRRVLARPTVLTGFVSAAIIEVLVAEDAAPIRVADTLPTGTVAISVLAARIGGALVAEFTAPTVSTFAFPTDVAVTVNGVATLLAHRYLTVGAFPTLYAHLVAVLVAGVMAEYVVPWPAELRAGRVVIMIRALDPNAISQMSVSPFMIESVPRGSWQDNAAETRFLDHACARLVSRLQDKRELPRPSKGEVQLQGDRFAEGEGVLAEGVTRYVAKATRAYGCDIRLVFLQAEPEGRRARCRARW